MTLRAGSGSGRGPRGPIKTQVPRPHPKPLKKQNQRLGYQRLAEVLKERGLVEPQAIDEILQLAAQGGPAFPEALIGANLVADWELSRLVCEIFNLPFLSVDIASPDVDALEGLDRGFLVQTGLVPLSRFGQILTVAMPAIVPAETLALLSARTDCTILPVVGTVNTNRHWIETNLNLDIPAPKETRTATAEFDADWSNLFDAGDAAVLAELDVVAGGLDLGDGGDADLVLEFETDLGEDADAA